MTDVQMRVVLLMNRTELMVWGCINYIRMDKEGNINSSVYVELMDGGD